jgi:hypothetical protein
MLGDSFFFFLCQNRPVSVFTLCYENLISSLIFFGLVRIDKGVKILNFFKFAWFFSLRWFLHIQ